MAKEDFPTPQLQKLEEAKETFELPFKPVELPTLALPDDDGNPKEDVVFKLPLLELPNG